MKAKKILLVEDDAKDVELTLTALEEQRLVNEVYVARDGAEALDYLFRRGAFAERANGHPLVVLLDLKLPKVNGIDVLRQIKADPALKMIPVVVLTSSQEEPDIEECYRLGANGYVVKPVDFDRFLEAARRVNLFWVLTNEPPPGARSGPGTEP